MCRYIHMYVLLSISRKGRGVESFFGSNDQSWSLFCSPSSYSFRHNKIWTDLPIKSIIRRIGVFVDHSAGTLSFYSVSDTMSLIHTVQTTFTQHLYPGCFINYKSSVKLCWWIRIDWREILPIMLWAAMMNIVVTKYTIKIEDSTLCPNFRYYCRCFNRTSQLHIIKNNW